MKTPLPLLAFVCALAAPLAVRADPPAPAAPPFSTANLLVVDWSQFGPGSAAGAIKTACADGTVVAYKDVTNQIANKLKTRAGYSDTPIPLYCAHINPDGQGHMDPIDAKVLNLTVYFPHALNVNDSWDNKGTDFKLNRTANSYPVVLRLPKPADFQPPQPAPKPAPPAPKPPRPTPPGPRPVPPVHRLSAIELQAHEKNWLALDEYIDYRTQHAAIVNAKPAPKDKHSKLMKLFAAFRAKIENNLPPASLSDYQAEIAKTPGASASAVAAYEAELDQKVSGYQYAASDTALTPDELTKLKTLPSSAGAPKTQVDDYNAELARDKQTVDTGEKADAADPDHDAANVVPYRYNILYYRTTTAYRKKIGGGPGNGGTVDPSLGLPDALKPYVKDQWPAYQTKRDADLKIIADPNASAADKTNAQTDLKAANEGLLQAVRSQQGTLSAADVAGVKNALSGVYSKYWAELCMPYTNPAGGAGMSAAPTCLTPDQVAAAETQQCGGLAATTVTAGKTAKDATTSTPNPKSDCITKIAKQLCGTSSSAATPAPAGQWSADPKSGLGLACLNGGPVNPNPSPINPGGGGTPPTPSGSAVNNQGNTSDATPATPDSNMMTHIRSGVTGALAGLILGTLFGPVGILVGAAIGFGVGYLGDRYLGSGKGS
jgi:hypothetical protein